MYKIIFPLLLAIFVGGCGDDKSNTTPLEFRPMKIMDIPNAGGVRTLDIYNDVYALTNRDNTVSLGILSADGTHESKYTLSESNISEQFGKLLSLSDKYLLVGNPSPDNMYLYKLEENLTANRLEKIKVAEPSSKIVAGGMVLQGDTIVVSELRFSFNKETFEDKSDYKLVVFKIESNESVTRLQEIYSDRNDTDGDLNFGASLSMDDGLMAVTDGCYIDIYAQDINSTFYKTDSFLLEGATADENCYLTLKLKGNYLSASSRRKDSFYLFTLKGAKIINSQVVENENSLSRFGKYSAFIDDGLLVASSKNLTIFTIQESDEETLLSKYADINTSADKLVASDKFFLLQESRNAEKFAVYDTYPLDKIFVYSDTDSPLKLNEGEVYSFYSVDANSPDGGLTYSLSGDDASYFDINGTKIINREAFDFDNPLDADGDNVYKITLNISDTNANTKSINFSVNIVDRDYMLASRKTADDTTEDKQLGKSVAVDGKNILVGAESSAYIFDADDALHQLLKIVPNGADVDSSFGYSVALSGNNLLVGAPYEDINDSDQGAVYFFKMDTNHTVTNQTKITMPTLNTSMLFGSSVAMDTQIIAVGASGNGLAYRHPGQVFLYTYDTNTKATLLQTIESNDSQIIDAFGNDIALGDNYLVVGSYKHSFDNKAYVGAVYVYKREADKTVNLVDVLQADTVKGSSYFGASVAVSGEYVVVSEMRGDLYIYKLDENAKAKKIAFFSDASGEVSIKGKDIFIVKEDKNHLEVLYHYVIGADDLVTLREKIENHTDTIISSHSFAVAQGDNFCVSGASKADINEKNSGVISLFLKNSEW